MTTDVVGAFDQRATGPLLRLAHHLARSAANDALHPLDLDLRHVGVLATLADRGPQTQRQLIDAVEMDKSSMVYVVDRLERQGLVSRERSQTDRRAYAVTLSTRGRELLAEAGKISAEVLRDLLDPLDADEQRQLNDMLRRIVNRARELRRSRR